jgi:polysaccharide biosynthesis protein PslH
MKILFLVPYTPTTIRTRPYNLIRALAKRGHSLTIATCWENQDEKEALERFSASGIHVITKHLSKPRIGLNLARAAFSGQPLQSQYSWHPDLARSSAEAIKQGEFDVIHVEHIRGARYAQYFKVACGENKNNIPVVWDSVDCISHLFAQASKHSRNAFGKWISRFELARTRKFEASLIYQFERVVVTSPVDAEALAVLSGEISSSPIIVLPNGVDLGYFSADGTLRSKNVVLFTGKLSYHANVTAAIHLVRDIMPRVWDKRPDVLVQLAGKDPHRSLTDLARSDSRVQITGTVPDLRPYIRQASVSVAPIVYGAGIQNKVLEAMACATPVVASLIAVSGLNGVHLGEEIFVARDPAEFSEMILTLLSDPELSQRIGNQAARYIRENYSWDSAVARLEDVYKGLVERTSHDL